MLVYLRRPQQAVRGFHVRFEGRFFWYDSEGPIVPFKVQGRCPVGRLVLLDTTAGALGLEQVICRGLGREGWRRDQYWSANRFHISYAR